MGVDASSPWTYYVRNLAKNMEGEARRNVHRLELKCPVQFWFGEKSMVELILFLYHSSNHFGMVCVVIT